MKAIISLGLCALFTVSNAGFTDFFRKLVLVPGAPTSCPDAHAKLAIAGLQLRDAAAAKNLMMTNQWEGVSKDLMNYIVKNKCPPAAQRSLEGTADNCADAKKKLEIAGKNLQKEAAAKNTMMITQWEGTAKDLMNYIVKNKCSERALDGTADNCADAKKKLEIAGKNLQKEAAAKNLAMITVWEGSAKDLMNYIVKNKCSERGLADVAVDCADAKKKLEAGAKLLKKYGDEGNTMMRLVYEGECKDMMNYIVKNKCSERSLADVAVAVDCTDAKKKLEAAAKRLQTAASEGNTFMIVTNEGLCKNLMDYIVEHKCSQK